MKVHTITYMRYIGERERQTVEDIYSKTSKRISVADGKLFPVHGGMRKRLLLTKLFEDVPFAPGDSTVEPPPEGGFIDIRTKALFDRSGRSILFLGACEPDGCSGARYYDYQLCLALAKAENFVLRCADHMIALYKQNLGEHRRLLHEFRKDLVSHYKGFDLIIGTPNQCLIKAVNYSARHGIPCWLVCYEPPTWLIEDDPDHAQYFTEESINMQLKAYLECDRIIAISEMCKEKLIEWDARFKDKVITVIEPYVNTVVADSVPEQEQKNEVTFIGRIIKQKQWSEMLEQLLKMDEPFDINMIGGQLIKARQKYRDGNKKHTINWHENITDAEKFAIIKRSKCGIVLSKHEGFGLVPGEFLYCGVPCIVAPLEQLKREYGYNVFIRDISLTDDVRGDLSYTLENIDAGLGSDIDYTARTEADMIAKIGKLWNVKELKVEFEPVEQFQYPRIEVEPKFAIDVCGGLFDASGYAHMLREQCLALEEVGVRVCAKRQYSGEHKTRPAFHPQIYSRLVNMTRNHNPHFKKVMLHATRPDTLLDTYQGYKIGETMLETNELIPQLVHTLNKMDEIWVPSTFNLRTFTESGVTVPIHVVPCPIDTENWNPDMCKTAKLNTGASFNFLVNVEWSGRKKVPETVRAYLEEFEGNDDVCLVVKGYKYGKIPIENYTFIQSQLQAILDTAKGDRLPKVRFYTDFIAGQSMPQFYNAFDSVVLCSAGEGYGYPYVEGGALSKKVVATRCSAQTDYLNDSNAYMVETDPWPVSADMISDCHILRGCTLAHPRHQSIRDALRQAYEDNNERAEKLRKHVHAEKSREALGVRLKGHIERVMASLAAKPINVKSDPSTSVPLGRKKIPATAIIVARNEEKTIAAAVANLRNWFSKILVIDNCCTDRTSEIATEWGAEVVKIDIDKDMGALRNEAMRIAGAEWCFFMDSDENADHELLEWIEEFLKTKTSEIFVGFSRVNYIDGIQDHDIYPDIQFRLVRRNVSWHGNVHEQPWGCEKALRGKGSLMHNKTRERHERRNAEWEEIQPGAGHSWENLVKERNRAR